jgi:hypothetical protein
VSGWGEGSGVFSPGEKATSSPLKAAAAVLTAPVEFFFLHKRNVRRYNLNYDSTCRCFICNSPDHLSKTCPNKDKKRYSDKQEEQEKVLIIDSVNENILVCDDDIMDDESIYSIIEIDEIEYEEESSEEEIDLIDELARIKIEMMDQ